MPANTSVNLPDDLLKQIKRDRQKAPVGQNFNLSELVTHLLREYYAKRKAAQNKTAENVEA
jgi:metal-responsive CopG/Arc/MetJ family transcriptional regulator